MSRPAVREIGDRNAYWHYQETGFGSWLWIYQGRGRTGILLPPEWHRRRLRRPPGWREGLVRNRVEPEGPARQERPRRVSSTTSERPGLRPGPVFVPSACARGLQAPPRAASAGARVLAREFIMEFSDFVRFWGVRTSEEASG